jgi:asparagine synthase (glutamine-hydrolysing)
MNCGFFVSADGSSAEVRLFGGKPATAPSLMSFSRNENGCAALMGRLHYRERLLAALSWRLGRDGDDATNDAALALAAYETWGADSILRLEGDYCFVVMDARAGVLAAGRDPMGGFPLYWTRSDRTFIVTTAIESVAARQPARLDPEFIAEYLSLPHAASQDSLTEASIYQGVRRVMPGSFLTARLADLRIETRRVWNWLEHIVDPGTDRTEAIGEQFEPLLRGAVRERMAGRVGAHFSGGMDSTAIALIADAWLGRGIGEPPLHAISLVYDLASLKRETPFIERALSAHPDIVSHRIAGDDLLPYDDFAVAEPYDEPCAVVLGRAQDQAIADVAAANGIDTLLTGCGGDDAFDLGPYHIAEMLRARRLRAAWREAAAWGKTFGRNPWSIVKMFGVAPLAPASLQGGVRALLHGGELPWRRLAPGTIAPWIVPRFARSHQLRDRAVAKLHALYSGCRPVALSILLASLRGLAGDQRRSALAQRGMMLAHPFMDPRILSLAMGVRLRYRQAADEQKPLLAHAMREVLPADIRRRRDKIHFNEVYFRGLSRNLPALEDAIRATSGELDVIDPGILIDCLRQASLGCEMSSAAGVPLNLTLSLVTWLAARRDGARPDAVPYRSIRLPLAGGRAEPFDGRVEEQVAQPC